MEAFEQSAPASVPMDDRAGGRSSRTTLLKIAGAAAGAIVVGIAIGVAVGRGTLERTWSQPFLIMTPIDQAKYSRDDADPVPKIGTKLLRAMPIGKSRAVLGSMTTADPAVVTVASVGQGEGGELELHVTVQNKSKSCKITGASGVAYGFSPQGAATAMNRHGESFVAIAPMKLEKQITPGGHAVLSQKLRYAQNATLALAHIDTIECEGGSGTWTRQP